MFSLLGSYLRFPEYILLAVSYRLIHNLEVVIRDEVRYSSNLGKLFAGGKS